MARAVRPPIDLPRFLLVRHLAAATVLVALVSTGFYLIVRRFFLRTWEDYSVSVAGHLSAEARHAAIPLPPPPDRVPDLDRLTRRHLEDLRVSKINIFDRDGRVAYSTNPAILGQRMSGNAKLVSALGGVPASSLELAHDEQDLGHDRHDEDLMETYVPLVVGGRIVGAYEVYQRVDQMYARLRRFRDVAVLGSLLIVLSLVGVVTPIARRAGRLIGEERAVRQQYEEKLRAAAAELEDEVGRRTRELRDERDRLRSVTDHVPSAFVLLDGERRIRLATRRFEDLVGVSPEEVVGRPCADTVRGRLGCGDCLAERAIETGRPQRAERLVVRNGGRPWWMEQIAVPVRPGGADGVVLEVVSDITERKQIEEGLVQSARLATIGEMAAVVAHEIRNALNSAQLLIQMMAAEPDRPPGREALGVAAGSMARAERLVANLLRFARPLPTRPAPADAAEVAREAAALVRYQFDRAGVRLDVATDGPLPAWLDADRMREALVNLLLNAAQATEAGGRVRVEVERARAPGDLGEAIRFAVRDDGRGMDAEEASRAFDPFFTTRTDGTGLGLPTVRRIVSDHGGTVTLESRPGGGTCVSLWLPPEEAACA